MFYYVIYYPLSSENGVNNVIKPHILDKTPYNYNVKCA
ncbi:hypothetical protein GGR42_000533 [Saonia flava]|uniref:Uncharacterized protein n=1 Tax=Saonia flava TaxID=523696 RepID=A0A846QPS2_9FLAO|nr:hypothetical protein [Saonia flava]